MVEKTDQSKGLYEKPLLDGEPGDGLPLAGRPFNEIRGFRVENDKGREQTEAVARVREEFRAGARPRSRR